MVKLTTYIQERQYLRPPEGKELPEADASSVLRAGAAGGDDYGGGGSSSYGGGYGGGGGRYRR